MDRFTADVWTEVLALLEDEISQIGYNTWIKTINPIELKNNVLTVEVSSSINKTMIEHRYLDLIKNSLFQVIGEETELTVFSADEKPKKTEEKKDYARIVGMPLNPKYTFDTFVVGKSNNTAHAAALAIAETPGWRNPLFLYSNSGLGKTHLLHAIGNYIKENNKDAVIAYISSESFMNEFIRSIKEKNTDLFRNKFRNVDVLMFDDIQFIAGKESTEEEFFHTFNTLHDLNKQIVITSDKHPDEIKTLEDRLRSRCEWGLIFDITPPDFETRVAILKKKAETEGVFIQEDILMYIADIVTSNIRELEGIFNKVLAYRGLENKEITMEVAAEALKYYEKNAGRKKVTPETILEGCAKYYQLKKEDLLGKRKTKEIAKARQICMYYMRDILGYSQLKIAKYFDKHHTTIMHGINEIEKEIRDDQEFALMIENLKEDILA